MTTTEARELYERLREQQRRLPRAEATEVSPPLPPRRRREGALDALAGEDDGVVDAAVEAFAAQVEAFELIFQRMDADGSNEVTLDEFEEFFRGIGLPGMAGRRRAGAAAGKKGKKGSAEKKRRPLHLPDPRRLPSDAPVLLPFADGDFLARLVEGRAARGGPGLWPELLSRRPFFDAADDAVRAAAPASELADGTIVERMLHHARERSLTPVACVLAGGDATGVRLRNLGMNTEAAPTSVQLAQFEVVLVCEDGSGAVHPLPLDGLGVAAAISLAASAPIRMPAATWEARRAVAMPEVESGIDLRSRLQ